MYTPFPETPAVDAMQIDEARAALQTANRERDELLDRMKTSSTTLSIVERRVRAHLFMELATLSAMCATIEVLSAHVGLLETLKGESDAV